MKEKIFDCISSILSRLGSMFSLNINIIQVDNITVTQGRDLAPHAIQQERMTKDLLSDETDDKN